MIAREYPHSSNIERAAMAERRGGPAKLERRDGAAM
jgi:hypothetical protein